MTSGSVAPINVAELKNRLDDMSKDELIDLAKKWSTFDSAGFLSEVKDLTRQKKVFEQSHKVLQR